MVEERYLKAFLYGKEGFEVGGLVDIGEVDRG